jgi:hypothetical protein
MRRILLLFLFLLPESGAIAQTKFACQLSDDKLSLRVVVTNPYDQETHCQVNCHLTAPGGGTISGSCGKTVPGKAADFLLCAQERRNKGQYGAVLASSNAECVKPLTDADRQKEDEDDDALIQKLQKDGQDALKRLQKGN